MGRDEHPGYSEISFSWSWVQFKPAKRQYRLSSQKPKESCLYSVGRMNRNEEFTSFPSNLTSTLEALLALYNPADNKNSTLQPFWLIYVQPYIIVLFSQEKIWTQKLSLPIISQAHLGNNAHLHLTLCIPKPVHSPPYRKCWLPWSWSGLVLTCPDDKLGR